MSRWPVYLTGLIGRQREMAAVCGLLNQHRLVSLIGAGGSGKTRLAAAVAKQTADELGCGVAWAELASLIDPELVAGQVRTAVGARDASDRPVIETLIEWIGTTPLLVVLDNCEHLIGACARLTDALLRGCPELRVLTTSRQALGIGGEKVWPVPPLSLPAAGDEQLTSIAGAEAVELFVQRASDVLPSFVLTEANAAAVVQICRRLDGLPLAIELAAARVRLLPPEQLARRLDHILGLAPPGPPTSVPRHRTLRALIDWSYDLLTERERTLLGRLAVFAGGFTLDAAEAVAADGFVRRDEVLESLAVLVDKSLVSMRERNGEARYLVLETVRQYAKERLRRPGDGGTTASPGAIELGRRHALHFLEVAERGRARLRDAHHIAWLDRLELDHDNLRAALRWSIATDASELALRLCAGLRDFWRTRGHLGEGRRWSEEALRLPDAPGGWRARVLVGAGELARLQGDHAVAREYAAAAEALAREAGDREALAEALTSRGAELLLQRELTAARACLEEATALWRQGGGAWGLTRALGSLGSVAQLEGDLALARAFREQAAEAARQAGDREGEARAWLGLGELARQQDDVASARAYGTRALALFEELGDTWHTSAALHNLGWTAMAEGETEQALQTWVAAFRVQAGNGNVISIGFFLAALSSVLHARGDSEAAARALAAAVGRIESAGIRPAPADARDWDRTRESIRSTLAQEAFDAAWAAGSAEDPRDTVAWALQRLGVPDAALPPERSAPEGAAAEREPGLRIRALGPLKIYRDGRLVDAETFGSAKPRELLLFLLCHPRGCTKEEVGRALWPGAAPSRVRSSFHTTLHRLRKALGDGNWIGFEGDRYRVDPPGGYVFDADEFARRITRALRHPDPPEAIAALEGALALYRGDLLEDELVGSWHFEIRDRLADLYRAGLRALAEHRFAAGDLAAARELYQRLVQKDELLEEAYRRLMVCHARLGDRPRALRVYRRLAELLRDELESEPEQETTALFHELEHGEP